MPMKYLVALFLVFLSAPLAVAADVISLKRGLPTDIWLTWPEAERLDAPEFSDVFPEYRRAYKGDEFKMVKQAGFDFVRLTIDPAVFLYNPRPEKTTKLLTGMKLAIAEIQAAGLKVDVDLHSIPRDSASPGTMQILASPTLFKNYLKVVAAVGSAIADLPADQIAFEPLNEPTVDCEWDRQPGEKPKWPDLLVALHNAARAAAPNLTLILSGGCWGGADGLVAVNPDTIADENVLWSFHNYEPFVFTHQGATWNDGHERYVTGLLFPPATQQKKTIMAAARKAILAAGLPKKRQRELLRNSKSDLTAYFEPGWAIERAKRPFAKVEAWAKTHAIAPKRIFLGEFGAIREQVFTAKRQKERAEFYGLMRREAEKRGYGWSTWSWSGSMGLTTTDTSRSFDPVMLRGLGLQK